MPNPDKRDKCVNEILFCQKAQKRISNLLNNKKVILPSARRIKEKI